MINFFLIAAILALSAFFSGTEIAFVSSSKLRIEMDKADGNWNSKILGLFYAHPNNFISTLLVGNNIALVIYGILMSRLISQHITHPLDLAPSAALAIETLISTLIVLFFGEFLPKTLFHINPNGMMKACALPALVMYIVLYPLSRLTSGISKTLLRLAGVKIKNSQNGHNFKKIDLDHLIQRNLDEVKDESEINEEIKIFQNALDFSNVRIRDCIVPRTEIDAVPLSAPLSQLQNQFIESGHSKIIVYDTDIDNVCGYVHSSELFHLKPGDRWQERVRPLPIVPETMAAQKLMHDLMSQKRTIAVVVDEFGGTSGIVTLEDLVEEIFGEIQDEHDKEEYVCSQIAPGEYLLSARLEVEQANEALGLELPTSEEYKTIGGLILHQHQSLPKLNEIIYFDAWEFKILKTSTTKIELVKLKYQS